MLLRSLMILIVFAPATAWPADWYTATVMERKPQSRELFVQGLEILDDQLYVSTGNYGKSRLLRYHFEDGSLDVSRNLASNLFGEGLTVLGDKIYQLTWREGQMLIYRKSDLALLESKPLPGEGWGLTNNGEQLIYSDGSAILRFLEPSNAKVVRSVKVTLQGRPIRFLNELEWIDGSIWANVWRSNEIIIIEPDSGGRDRYYRPGRAITCGRASRRNRCAQWYSSQPRRRGHLGHRQTLAVAIQDQPGAPQGIA